MRERSLVDFLGIGAQKSGTSWLDAQLRRHPQVWLPPLKELHYFDRPRDGLRERLTHRRVAYRQARRALVRGTLRGDWLRAPGEYAWYARFLLGRRSDAWYRSLFAPGERAGLCTGEITPRYALLDAGGVDHAARAVPDARILYLIRNPVERAWSNLKMGADRYGAPDRWPGGELPDRLLATDVIAGGRYREVLERWEARFPAERILVGFFEEIQREPEALLRRVYRFLGVDEGVAPVDPGARVNPGPPDPMPAAVRRQLGEVYGEEIRALHARLDSPYTREWLESLEASGAAKAGAT